MAELHKNGNSKEPYYTIAHFATLKQVTIQTIYRRIAAGELETTKMNGLTFVRNKAKTT